ncbi:GIY-YIG nuclease family protein [Ereboglobus luteus]|uniref:Bacteriophage T5 Orf172 DNA-binding domain-containing protein n=1 Tax=Ereboglobus luteus TaxID=1796921 RepID=A0A2U8E5G3_9BACT|nr:GIY-YIG nuclease family protein [Ereboglobus luteus]AWI09762.1 hypothetical protein CKA38_11340 [Ereboglobus luteus]
MAERITNDDLELLDKLGVEVESEPASGRTPKEQRIIAGFEEIEHFFEAHGRLPQHGEDRDIFERLYAVRLERIRDSVECLGILEPLDKHGLLGKKNEPEACCVNEDSSDAALLESLGVDGQQSEISQLVHVRSREEIKAAEEVARRTLCADFDHFKPMFEKVQQELTDGSRQTLKYQDNAEVNQGDMFILDGQKILVASVGASFVNDYGRPDRRLRVIYDNGTESDLLVRSLQRALNKDKTSRRITKPDHGPLFSDQTEEDDVATGCVYVLRSKSDHPFVAQNRNVLHKIGVTGGDVKNRIANAKKDPTYLLADVEIVATFKLANINREKLEALLHKFFASARLDVELKDRFGTNIEPREWFLVPFSVIEEAIEKLKDGSIEDYRYNPERAQIVKRNK